MDYQFPTQLFPSFYKCGPPDSVLTHSAGNWGSYDRIRPQGGSGPLSSWTFTPRHHVRGETWHHTEPVPLPLLSPKNSFVWPLKPPDPLDFTEHMQNFYLDHRQDVFECMGEILSGSFNFRERRKWQRGRKDSVRIGRLSGFLNKLEFKTCTQPYPCQMLNRYSALLWDAVPAIPPELLAPLLFEELTEQRDRMLFSEGATGGALAFVPFSQSGGDSQHGCLLYPRNRGLNRLNFHRVELQHHRGGSSRVDISSSPISFQLKGPVRQISTASLLNDCCVAVRSHHLCGVWRFSERNEPRLLQVVNTREVATCISVSPHILGEVLVASESGAAHLWTVGRGLQKIKEEDHNLYFNAKSSWRWCEFSAHPRVMLYVDRTGVELTDIRESPASSHTLFRISNTSECRSGERLILSKYLGDVHPFHHLITTQYSAYIMDERFPCMPMIKWDHMMQSPPMFCHAVRGSSSGGAAKTTKILLGSQSSQEITMLQYSGGRAEASSSRGPPQALLRPRDSLRHLPVQIPHRLETATNRLSSHAAGLTYIQTRGGGEAGGHECICILQLTEAGDIFYQILEPDQPDASGPPAADAELPTKRTSEEASTSGRKTAKQLRSQMVVSDTSSDEDVIGPTQAPTTQRFVAETPEREQRARSTDSDSSKDSESGGRARHLKQAGLQVVVNDELEPEREGGQAEAVNDAELNNPEENVSSGPAEAPVKLSDGALVTWKHWLQKLMRKSRGKKPRPRRQRHLTVDSRHLVRLCDDRARDSEEERVQSLRRDLRACMTERSMLVHSTASASLGAQDVVAVPDRVDTDVWTDQISNRLTVSWQGEEAWRAWWVDHLGLNTEQKVEALRRKRRREKEAKRASGRRLELSGSFVSSVSYQSDLNDVSDLSGWSSAVSQGAVSDAEDKLSQLDGFSESETPGATAPSTPLPTPTPTPQSVKSKQNDQQTPSSSRALVLSQTPKPDPPPGNQRSKRPAEDYLNFLFASQDEPSQHDGYFLEEGSGMPPRPAASPQLRSSQSVSQRSLRVDLSQDASVWSGFSQSLSQSSQGRWGLSQASQSSQASQPKKKKSRMGF